MEGITWTHELETSLGNTMRPSLQKKKKKSQKHWKYEREEKICEKWTMLYILSKDLALDTWGED
jgi:hypothetical protein